MRRNKALVRRVQALWDQARTHLRGRLWLSHVYGHTGHCWNDRADELARMGRDERGEGDG